MSERKLGSDAVLDLHAIQQRIGSTLGEEQALAPDAMALLTALRETRQAAQRLLNARRGVFTGNKYQLQERRAELRAVLARCRDPQ